MQELKLGIVGCGLLGGVVVGAWRDGLLAEYEIVGCLGRRPGGGRELAGRAGCAACDSLDDLMALRPDYVVEAAAPAAVRAIAEPVLKGGANLVVLSIGAFADTAFLDHIGEVAREAGTRVHLASGAIGGFDVLRTIALMGCSRAGITSTKGAAGLAGTPAWRDSLLTDSEPSDVFSGNAEEAIARFPTKVNVAVATALATAGIAGTRVAVRHVPGYVGDDQLIEAAGGERVGDEVRAVIDVYSRTAAIAGWSVVALLRNLVSPIVF